MPRPRRLLKMRHDLNKVAEPYLETITAVPAESMQFIRIECT